MTARIAFRWTLIAHRYLGIAVGVLMVIWCLSGAVMVYVPYPRLTETERVRHLAPIPWQSCCTIAPVSLMSPASVEGFQLEVLGSDPIVRVRYGDGSSRLVNLSTGRPVDQVSSAEAAFVAARYGAAAEARLSAARVDYDQWTVQGAHGPSRPLYRFALNDRSSTEVYVSTRDGRAVQVTSERVRFWNRLGAVPHWLYVPVLRSHPAAWTQTVVWTSVLGCFLTLTGLIIGIVQVRRASPGRWTPYRGLHYWHHLLGLVFGVVLLTWIVSGLLSMNPWGLLEGSGFEEPQRLAGRALTAEEVTDVLRSFTHPPGDVVSVESAQLGGVLYMVATRPDGTRIRLDRLGAERPLAAADLEFITRTIDPAAGGYRAEMIDREDTYYFSHNDYDAELPVLRLTTSSAAGSRYYLDPVSGGIRAKLDRDGQQYRWWHQALHRWDFAAALRSHPIRDLVLLILLAGAAVVCGVGTYLGFRGLRR